MALPDVVSQEAWLDARKELLAEEKAMTRARDALNVKRRELPMVKIDKAYSFTGPEGVVGLGDLFAGRRQLIVQHFMFDPSWDDGCPSCTAGADEISAGLLAHLHSRDTTFVAVSRAPLEKLHDYKKRRGWDVPFVSSFDSDFNYDFEVSVRGENREASGTSFFYRDASGEIFHTYASRDRGDEGVLGTYALLDRVPKGRDETVRGNLTDWVRHHDRYDRPGSVDPTGRYVAS